MRQKTGCSQLGHLTRSLPKSMIFIDVASQTPLLVRAGPQKWPPSVSAEPLTRFEKHLLHKATEREKCPSTRFVSVRGWKARAFQRAGGARRARNTMPFPTSMSLLRLPAAYPSFPIGAHTLIMIS